MRVFEGVQLRGLRRITTAGADVASAGRARLPRHQRASRGVEDLGVRWRNSNLAEHAWKYAQCAHIGREDGRYRHENVDQNVPIRSPGGGEEQGDLATHVTAAACRARAAAHACPNTPRAVVVVVLIFVYCGMRGGSAVYEVAVVAAVSIPVSATAVVVVVVEQAESSTPDAATAAATAIITIHRHPCFAAASRAAIDCAYRPLPHLQGGGGGSGKARNVANNVSSSCIRCLGRRQGWRAQILPVPLPLLIMLLLLLLLSETFLGYCPR